MYHGCCAGGGHTCYVSRYSSHSAPVTHASAESLPLSRPHSKSSHSRISRPYFSSIARACFFAPFSSSNCSSLKVDVPASTLCTPVTAARVGQAGPHSRRRARLGSADWWHGLVSDSSERASVAPAAPVGIASSSGVKEVGASACDGCDWTAAADPELRQAASSVVYAF